MVFLAEFSGRCSAGDRSKVPVFFPVKVNLPEYGSLEKGSSGTQSDFREIWRVDLKIAENAAILQMLPSKPDWRKSHPLIPRQAFAPFSLEGTWQSGFNYSIRRMQGSE